MNIVVYGATGNAGTTVTTELLSRGHTVTAVSRSATTSIAPQPNLTLINDDISDPAHTASIIRGADAVVSTIAPPMNDTDQIIGISARLTQAVQQAAVPRLLIMGGAGSLFVKPGITLAASGFLPPEYTAIVNSHIQVFEAIKKSTINWTYFSPAAIITRGPRTGAFRLGHDDLITDPEGNSKITYEDFAIALVDELETPKHEHARFTIGY